MQLYSHWTTWPVTNYDEKQFKKQQITINKINTGIFDAGMAPSDINL
jgi:hypothetical protein